MHRTGAGPKLRSVIDLVVAALDNADHTLGVSRMSAVLKLELPTMVHFDEHGEWPLYRLELDRQILDSRMHPH